MRKCYYFKMLAVFSVLLFSAQYAMAQYTVSGTVTDAATGETLVGVTIFDGETNTGTSTDIDGEYSLELSAGETTLRFSSVGYVTRNIDVSGSNGEEVTLDVEMQSDVANLEELVVTGLASSVKRENLANAIESISADELTGSTNPETIDNALSGKIPGVNIRVQDGAPGGGVNMQLRGISTLGAGTSQPLYIIDGVYLNNSSISSGRFQTTGANSSAEDNSANRLADINPDEIESIEVLKGPSAAAIYGQRANAGVVIINTKRGVAGDTKVSFEQGVGFSSALNLLGYPEWNENKIAIYDANFGLPGSVTEETQKFQDAVNEGRIINYEEELYGNRGAISNTSIAVSGGNSKTRFFVSGTINAEEGIIKNTGFDRNSIRVNLNHNVSDRIRISSNSNFIKTDNQRGFTGNQNGTGAAIGYALTAIPSYADLLPDSEGNFPNNPYFDDNPLAIVEHAQNDEDITRFLQSVSLDADLYAGENSLLTFSIDGGFDFLNYEGFVYTPEFLQHEQASANPGSVVHTNQSSINANLQAVLVFQNTVGLNSGEALELTTQAGFARFDQDQARKQMLGQGLTPGQISIGQARVQSVTNQSEQSVFDVGYFAQQEVNWAEKLIATVGGRLDRSSLNFDQSAYYFYPKASLAANLSNFDFLNVEKLDQLKLRIAYGETGGLPNYGNTFSTLNGVNIGGNLGLTASNTEVDPTLIPERAKELEFGTDISVFAGFATLSATYYNKTVEDLILNLNTAPSTGVNAIATNAATLENTGIELAVGVNPIRNENFDWSSTILYWKNDSEITELSVPAFIQGGFGASLGTYLLQEGYSPTTIVGNPPVSGDSFFTVYGDANPDYQMSFRNEFNFLKNFNFNFLLHYSSGGDNINLTQFLQDNGGTSADWNVGLESEGAPVKVLERLGSIPGAYIQDATYLKLREVSLNYTVPSSFLEEQLGSTLRGVRVGLSGNNLIMWTDYASYDPEVSVFGTQAINRSVEVTPYPTSRRVMLNIKLDF